MTLEKLVGDTRSYVASQSDTLGGQDGAEFKIMLAAQFHALRMQIDSYEDGLDTEDAPPLLEEIRAGRWRESKLLR